MALAMRASSPDARASSTASSYHGRAAVRSPCQYAIPPAASRAAPAHPGYVGAARQGQHALGMFAPFGQVAAHLPEAPAGGDDPHRHLGLAAGDGPGQCGADVVVLALESVQDRPSAPARRWLPRPPRPGQGPRRRAGRRSRPPRRARSSCSMANSRIVLEHPESRLAIGLALLADEALVDQRGDRVEGVGGRRRGRRRPARWHRAWRRRQRRRSGRRRAGRPRPAGRGSSRSRRAASADARAGRATRRTAAPGDRRGAP